jgi:hypothetical protein
MFRLASIQSDRVASHLKLYSSDTIARHSSCVESLDIGVYFIIHAVMWKEAPAGAWARCRGKQFWSSRISTAPPTDQCLPFKRISYQYIGFSGIRSMQRGFHRRHFQKDFAVFVRSWNFTSQLTVEFSVSQTRLQWNTICRNTCITSDGWVVRIIVAHLIQLSVEIAHVPFLYEKNDLLRWHVYYTIQHHALLTDRKYASVYEP